MATEERDDPYKVPKSAQAAKPKKQRLLRPRDLLVVVLTSIFSVLLLEVSGLGDAMMAAIDGLVGHER